MPDVNKVKPGLNIAKSDVNIVKPGLNIVGPDFKSA